jgi:hypothetical protein
MDSLSIRLLCSSRTRFLVLLVFIHEAMQVRVSLVVLERIRLPATLPPVRIVLQDIIPELPLENALLVAQDSTHSILQLRVLHVLQVSTY